MCACYCIHPNVHIGDSCFFVFQLTTFLVLCIISMVLLFVILIVYSLALRKDIRKDTFYRVKKSAVTGIERYATQ